MWRERLRADQQETLQLAVDGTNSRYDKYRELITMLDIADELIPFTMALFDFRSWLHELTKTGLITPDERRLAFTMCTRIF